MTVIVANCPQFEKWLNKSWPDYWNKHSEGGANVKLAENKGICNSYSNYAKDNQTQKVLTIILLLLPEINLICHDRQIHT